MQICLLVLIFILLIEFKSCDSVSQYLEGSSKGIDSECERRQESWGHIWSLLGAIIGAAVAAAWQDKLPPLLVGSGRRSPVYQRPILSTCVLVLLSLNVVFQCHSPFSDDLHVVTLQRNNILCDWKNVPGLRCVF